MTTAELHENTLAGLLEQLGGIPAHRVLLTPPPGTATEDDVASALALPRKRVCELIDGVLVEKAMSTREAYLASYLLRRLAEFVEEHDLGLVLPGDAPTRLWPGRVRIPDVYYIPWERLPGERLPNEPIASLAPELAAEVLTPNNTEAEMDKKLRDYFKVGCKLAWIIDPATKSAKVHTSPKRLKELNETDILDGGKVLPGFKLPLAELFSSGERRKKAH